MSLEAPLSMNFVQDYFTATYSTSTPISFRAINSALGRTTPDAFSDFLNNQVDRFNHVTGAFAISSATGDLTSTFLNYKTFQDFVSAGSQASSVWKLINTYHYGYSPLSGDYQIKMYVNHDFTSGSFNGNIFVEQSTTSSGPWSVKGVMFSLGGGVTTSITFTPSTSDNDYFRIRLDNTAASSGTLTLGIGIEVT